VSVCFHVVNVCSEGLCPDHIPSIFLRRYFLPSLRGPPRLHLLWLQSRCRSRCRSNSMRRRSSDFPVVSKLIPLMRRSTIVFSSRVAIGPLHLLNMRSVCSQSRGVYCFCPYCYCECQRDCLGRHRPSRGGER